MQSKYQHPYLLPILELHMVPILQALQVLDFLSLSQQILRYHLNLLLLEASLLHSTNLNRFGQNCPYYKPTLRIQQHLHADPQKHYLFCRMSVPLNPHNYKEYRLLLLQAMVHIHNPHHRPYYFPHIMKFPTGH